MDIFDELSKSNSSSSSGGDIFDELSEQPSRARSLTSAFPKGFLKGASQLPSVISGPIPLKAGHKATEKVLPTQKRLPEELLERGGELSAYSIGGPESFLAKGAQAAGGALLGHAAKEGGLGPVGQTAAEIAGMSLGSKGKNLFQKSPNLFNKEARLSSKASSQWKSLERSTKGSPQKEAMLTFAKEKSLTPEETTLLLQSNGKIDKLSRISKKTKKYKGAVNGLREKLGQNYEDLKSLGRKGGYLSPQASLPLAEDFGKILQDMGRTLIEGPETKAARNLLEDTLERLDTRGATIEDLINSRINLSQGINWNKINPKRNFLNEGRETLLKGIEKQDPKIGKELRMVDEGWAKYKKHAKTLDKSQAVMKIMGYGVPTNELVFFAGLKGLLGASIPGVAKTVAAKEGIQRLATQMLINPKFQGIAKKLREASLKGAQNKQILLLRALKKSILEEDPELYEELQIQ